MKQRLLLMISWMLVIQSCHPERQQPAVPEGNHYAMGFTIQQDEGYSVLKVRNPWEQARNVEVEYYLLPRGDTLPDGLTGKNIIRVPVRRVICLSTSHLAFLEALGEAESISGISGIRYVSSPEIEKRIAEGKITDVGYGPNLDYEGIIRQKPDLVMVYGVDNEIVGFLDKFRDLGIPAVILAEYLEETPLGKAEWIRFTAEFFGKASKGDSIFSEIETKYLKLANKAGQADERPFVMVGLPYRDVWWIPGGRSYLAQLIADAGGIYVGRDNPSHESYVISREKAITLSSEASIWINTGNVASKSDIIAADSRFSQFPLFRNARIYNNNKRSTPGGGMDFWESGTLRPDLILSDLIRIFHPGLLPEEELTYYREIK